ncbi:MAG: sulfatase-like hydrolase/transferase [Planctomycetota bacterium]|nr:sulfatase-like hydrolase/transferase [Planctomycetota bacterium]
MSRPVRVSGGCRWLVFTAALAVFGGSYLFKGCDQRPGADEVRAACGRGHEVVALIIWDGVDVGELDLLSTQRSATPTLASLAEGGRAFRAHSASSSGTNAALASLLTGLSPRRHGVGSVHSLGRQTLAEECTTMAELFRAAGYRTLAAVSLGQLDGALSGLDQGFDVYEGPALVHPPRWPRSAADTLASIAVPLREALSSSGKVFLFLHLADSRDRAAPDALAVRPFLRRALEPWRSSSAAIAGALDRLEDDPTGALDALGIELLRRRGDPARGAFVRALYAARLARMDAVLREVTDAIDGAGRRDEALVVVTGGISGALPAPLRPLPARGDPEPRLHAPLVLRSAGLRWGAVGGLPTRDVDVFATLTGVFGREGRDLWAQSSGRGGGRDAVLIEDAEFSRRVAMGREWMWCSSITGDSLVRSDGAPVLPGSALELPEAQGGFWSPAQVRDSFAEVRALERLLEGEPPLGVLRIAGRAGEEGVIEVRARSFGGPILAPWSGLALDGPAPRAAGIQAFDLPPVRGGTSPAWTHLRASRRGETLELRLRASTGTLEAERVFIGGRSLAELDLPLVPDERAPAWPGLEDGQPRPCAASIARGGGGRLTLSVPGDGVGVRAVLDMHPACDPPLVELLAVPNGVQVAVHPTRLDAVVLSGATPLEVTIARPRKTPRSTLCLTLDLDGRRVARERVCYLDRFYGIDDEVRLAIPATAWNDPRLYGRPGIERQGGGGVWIELLDPRPPAELAAALDVRGEAIIGYLGRSE